MPTRELLSELRGLLVIAREEGANLGVVSGIYFDPEAAKISCLTLGRRKGKSRVVDATDVISFGRDVVMVSSEVGVKTVEEAGEPRGRSLKDLQGLWVTTHGGERLGTLVDVDVGGEDWSISEIRLADDKRLPVVAGEIVIGRDEILVPKEYAGRVTADHEKPGFIGRLFGREAVEDAGSAIRRALKRAPRPRKDEDEGPTR
jgi:sporulation protein YlmC with PRC-barrel domain